MIYLSHLSIEAANGPMSIEAVDRGIISFQSFIEWVSQLPYKRNSNQADYTLVFEEEQLAREQRAKEDLQKKQIKTEKTLAFFKLFAANAEKDPSTALTKTLTETLLANAVAAAFFTGTEHVASDLKGNKIHSGRDGYVVAVDGSERVMTGEQNKKVGDLSNEELAQLAHDHNTGKLLPNYLMSNNSHSVAGNLKESMQLNQLINVNKRLESLENTIRNKPETIFELNNLGEVIRTEVSNQMRKSTTFANKKNFN